MNSQRPTGVCDHKILERTRKIFNSRAKERGGFQINAIGDCELTYAEKGYVEATLKVAKLQTNPGDIMHGGCVSTIVDEVTSAAIYTNDLRPMMSLSVNTTYLRAIPLGANLLLRGWVDKSGKSVAFAKIEIILKDSGKVAATGEHHQFFPPGFKPIDPDNLPWRPEPISKV